MAKTNQERYRDLKDNFARYHTKYMENYCEVKARMTHEKREQLQKYCKERNISVSAFINNLIDKEMGNM